MRRFLIGAILALTAVLPGIALAEDQTRIDRLEQELRDLKQENQEIKKRLDGVAAESEETRDSFGRISSFVNISGYADAEFYLTDNDSDNAHFRVRHLSLFFIKDIQKEWRLFSEIEYEDAPLVESEHTTDDPDTVQGKLLVEQMYIEYHPELDWNVRAGRFITPAGLWNIYHYPPYVPTQTRPLMVRRIFPQVSDGVQLMYSFTAGESVVDTHLYVANGAGNPGRLDRNEEKAWGARAHLQQGSHGLGASVYREIDNVDILRNALGLHYLWDFSPFRFQTEYQYRQNSPDTGSDFIDRGFYAQLTYDIGKWTLAARYDWYDPNGSQPQADIFRYTGAVNYHFAYNVVGKAEYNRNVFEDSTEDYNEVILAIVVAIGDL